MHDQMAKMYHPFLQELITGRYRADQDATGTPGCIRVQGAGLQ